MWKISQKPKQNFFQFLFGWSKKGRKNTTKEEYNFRNKNFFFENFTRFTLYHIWSHSNSNLTPFPFTQFVTTFRSSPLLPILSQASSGIISHPFTFHSILKGFSHLNKSIDKNRMEKEKLGSFYSSFVIFSLPLLDHPRKKLEEILPWLLANFPH